MIKDMVQVDPTIRPKIAFILNRSIWLNDPTVKSRAKFIYNSVNQISNGIKNVTFEPAPKKKRSN